MSDTDDEQRAESAPGDPSSPMTAGRGLDGGAPAVGLVRMYPAPSTPEPSFPKPQHRQLPAAIDSALAPRPPQEPENPGLTAIGPVSNERKARDWALVLQSMSIWHAIRRSQHGWIVLVRDGDYPPAVRAIDGYETENRDWPPKQARERPRHASSPIVPLMFVALCAFFAVTGPAAAESRWFDRGEAVGNLILGPEPWRAVTALTLHADSVHVLGNAISGTIFTAAVQRRIGAGGAALVVLASGVLGNAANALFYHAIHGVAHRSIGASTAVFGAVGILSATQLVLDRAQPKRKRPWTDIAAPLVGGFALLGALGAGGETTDLGAHLFGFLAGLLLGLVAAWPLGRSAGAIDLRGRRGAATVQLGAGAPRWWVQVSLGAIAAGTVFGSWFLAMKR